MELWEVFRDLMSARGVKVADVANATGLKYTTVDSIIKKRIKDIKYSSAKKIANYFGVPIEFLVTGITPDNLIPFDPNSLVMIPVYGEIAAGQPIYADQTYGDMFPLDRQFINLKGYDKEDYFYLRVKGDSMEPGIMDKDLVLVRRQDSVDNNELAVVIYDGETATVKRVVQAGENIILHSDNKQYAPQIFKTSECRILGKVLNRFGIVR